jgi:uncharacterized protein (TIGR03000 family)
MNRLIPTFSIVVALCLGGAGEVQAWGGRGVAVGGFRAGGVAAGGYRAGGVAVGGYRGVAAGGYRAGGVAVGGYRAGGVAVGGYRAGGVAVGGARYGAVGGVRYGGVGYGGLGYRGYGGLGYGTAVVHTPLVSDFGFGHVANYAGARGYIGAGHFTTPYYGGALAVRGAAIRGGYYNWGAFGPGWWGANVGAWRPYGWNVGRAWGVANWAGLSNWFGWTAAPIAYDYGSNIAYQGDQVYVDDQPGPTADAYYQQAADLAQTAPAAAPPADENGDAWMPLGVFSLVQGEQSDTSAVFQLAVNKAGVIRGNYYNVLTSTTLPVRGAVDQTTQRASWIVGDQKTTVYDTGIVNLTKDESPVLIHFGKERTQQWLLVRLKESDATAPQPPASPAEAAEAAAIAPPPPAPADDTAKITVILPADAELYVDGHETKEVGAERVFATPPLVRGKDFSYSFRAVWTEDGKPVERTRKVTFQAGSQLRVDFTSPVP